MTKSNGRGPAGIQYVGEAGVSSACRDAVLRYVQWGTHIDSARILTCDGTHGLLLTVDGGDLVAVKTGFGSGYGGQGPRCFSYLIEVFLALDVEISECDVEEGLLHRLDLSALSASDVHSICTARTVRPSRIFDYFQSADSEQDAIGRLWREFPPIVPLAIVDARIADLAADFGSAPDQNLLAGYRRLEMAVRKKSGLKLHGQKLFQNAFAFDKGPLFWRDLPDSERIGRCNLFVGAFMAHRNRRAHSEQSELRTDQVSEFLVLNHLFRLERTATKRRRRRGQQIRHAVAG